MPRAFDREWFLQLKSLSLLDKEQQWLREYMRVSRAERERFINDEIENPLFKIDVPSENLDRSAEINTLRAEIAKSATDPIVIDLYERKLTETLKRYELVAASMRFDDEVFFRVSQQIYGTPKKEFFAYIALRIIQLCDQHETEYPSEVKRLRKVFSKINTEEVSFGADMLPPRPEHSPIVTGVDSVITIFKETLGRFSIHGWEIVSDEDGVFSHFAVRHSQKTIIIPNEERLLSRRTPLSEAHVRAIAEHEIGVHVRRANEALALPLYLLRSGLDGYLAGEEGLGGYVQQQIEGADEFYGFDRYMAASLAIGMDGTERDFRAVFSLMRDFYTLTDHGKGYHKESAFRAAWDVCVRIFRGTTGQSAGKIYTKDIVYLEGNIGIWQLLSERPHVFESLFIGKFNPLSKRHVKSLQTLEILKEW